MLHFFLARPMISARPCSTKTSYYAWTFRLSALLRNFCCSRPQYTTTGTHLLENLTTTFPRFFFLWFLLYLPFLRRDLFFFSEDIVVLFDVFFLSLGSLQSLPRFWLSNDTELAPPVVELKLFIAKMHACPTRCPKATCRQVSCLVCFLSLAEAHSCSRLFFVAKAFLCIWSRDSSLFCWSLLCFLHNISTCSFQRDPYICSFLAWKLILLEVGKMELA